MLGTRFCCTLRLIDGSDYLFPNALIWIKTLAPAEGQMFQLDMANFVFKCPGTGLNVQHWIAEEPAPGASLATYETVVCKACTRLHFINRTTGKLLGETEPATDPPRFGA
jgi:hypothetical protein